MRVLIVDDDVDFATTVALLVEDEGHRAEVAYSGEDALELGAAEQFDLALIDLRLPGIDGVDCLRELRTLCPSTKCAMMTGYSVEEVLSEALDSGAVQVLRKPFKEQELLALLAS